MNVYGGTIQLEKKTWKGQEAIDIVSGDGDVSTEFYPGSFTAIGLHYKINGHTVSKISCWSIYFVIYLYFFQRLRTL